MVYVIRLSVIAILVAVLAILYKVESAVDGIPSGERRKGHLVENLDRSYSEFQKGVFAIAFLPDGKHIVSGGQPEVAGAPTIHIREVDGGRISRVLESNGARVRCIAVSSDGMMLAAGGDESIWIWSLATWTVIHRLGKGLPPAIDVAFTSDGKALASCHWGMEDATEDHPIYLWNCSDGQSIGRLNSRSGVVESICFSPDGNSIAVGGWDGAVRVFDVQRREERLHLEGRKPGPIRAVAFSCDGKRLASLTRHGSVCIWDPFDGRLVTSLDARFGRNPDCTLSADALRYAPTGETLALSLSGMPGDQAPILIVDGSTGRLIQELMGHRVAVNDFLFLANGKQLMSAGEDGIVSIWNLKP